MGLPIMAKLVHLSLPNHPMRAPFMKGKNISIQFLSASYDTNVRPPKMTLIFKLSVFLWNRRLKDRDA